MEFDLEHFKFGTLYIDGNLIIDRKIDEMTIEANNIWVRAGMLKAG